MTTRNRSRGQALVEFALVAPVLFVIILGVIEVGRLVFLFHNMNNAAREGVRYAIIHGENAFDRCPSGPLASSSTLTACDSAGNNVRDAITDSTTALDASILEFGWSGDGGFPLYWGPYDGCTSDTLPGCSTSAYNARGNNVTVRIAYPYSPLILGGLFGTITMRAESTGVINN